MPVDRARTRRGTYAIKVRGNRLIEDPALCTLENLIGAASENFERVPELTSDTNSDTISHGEH